MEEKYKVYFFAGGEAGDNRFNTYTASFIRLMSQILGKDFEFMKDIHFRSPAFNVLWALHHAQIPISRPDRNPFISSAVRQIVNQGASPGVRIVITSSSTGSIVAAQTACHLASLNSNNRYFLKPFHLALGTSIISPQSDLFRKLNYYRDNGLIGSIIHDELQDEGDNTTGAGGINRLEAYRNAFGLILPSLSRKYDGPSFLNSHPVRGHLHRKRSNSLQKALDHIRVILVKHELAGKVYREKAEACIEAEMTR